MHDILKRDITKELGLDSLPEEERQKVLERIGKLIYESVMIRVVEVLDEEDQDAFASILEEVDGDPAGGDKILKFIKSKVPNIEEIVEEEVVRFKQESLDVMEGLE
ncbi:hypothetical protein ISS03_04590 [Patescibacteria group bacterium]|nr:hypothetical protein [Patescibacteria group bacterium]